MLTGKTPIAGVHGVGFRKYGIAPHLATVPKEKPATWAGYGRCVLRSVHYNSVEPASSASPDCCIVWQVSGLRGNVGIGSGCLVRLAKALQRQPLSVNEATRVVSSIKMFVQYGEFHSSMSLS